MTSLKMQNECNSLIDIGSLKSEKEVEWLTTVEAANFLKISYQSLLNMTSNGKITVFKLGRRNRYRKDLLNKFLLNSIRGANYDKI
jgi:excisionase family DNA binding protein